MCRAAIAVLLSAALAGGAMAFELRSADFASNASMPAELTCEGADRSPALAWSGAPDGTKSFALVVDDPDAPDPAAPRMTWVHWVLYDLPATTTALGPGASKALPSGTRSGINDWKKPAYGGPCPPVGRHRYFHKLYALDTTLGDQGALTKSDLERRMSGHVLAQAELIGTYQKTGR